jgi:hypothetical protein
VMLALAKRLALVVPPAVMTVALTQKWYFAETDTGDVYRTRYPLTQDLLKVTLVCCCVYVVIAIVLGLRFKWVLAVASMALSSIAVATLFAGHGRMNFALGDPLGQKTVWYPVAVVAGLVWVIESVGLLILAALREPTSATGDEVRNLRERFRSWTRSFYVPEASSDSSLERLSGLRLTAWFGIASCIAMVVGAFGPWAKALTGLGGLSVSGTDGSNDGWVVVAVAILGGSALVAASKRHSVRAAIGAVVLGLVSVGVCLEDRVDLENVGDSDSAVVQAGWGLNLALLASIAFTIDALTLIRRRTFGATPSLPTSDAPSVRANIQAYMANAAASPTVAHPGLSAEEAGTSLTSRASELERLAALYDRGALSDEEFTSAKRQLLGA